MICAADTIGVFQIESRAQMSMLPRLRPRCYYDLVIEVAIVRPGPIQGDMVHPYLRRRNGEEPIEYPDEVVERLLGRTLGVPLFQEQAMSMVMHCAGFSAGEADQLRRAIAAWKTKYRAIERFGVKIIEGMMARGYAREFAERCFKQIQGFSEYGFPESHAASFAHLVYVSSWLKKYYPAQFAAALINSQPMGFYAPAQIVRDAQEHGVDVRGIDVNASGWDCRMEERHEGTKARRHEGGEERCEGEEGRCMALRLGIRLIKGLREDEARRIEEAVGREGELGSIEALWRASGVRVRTLRTLASADAFRSMGLGRQEALWELRALRDEEGPLFERQKGRRDEGTEGRSAFASKRVPFQHTASLRPSVPLSLPSIPDHKKVIQDYASVGLSLRGHPVSFMREELAGMGAIENGLLKDERAMPSGARVKVAGIALVRQRPATASGVVFMTIEDETGIANLIIRPKVYERYRSAARHGVIVMGEGRVERQGEVVHVNVWRIRDLSDLVEGLQRRSRDFR